MKNFIKLLYETKMFRKKVHIEINILKVSKKYLTNNCVYVIIVIQGTMDYSIVRS